MTESEFQNTLLGLIPPSFVRGALATAIVSAVQDGRRGQELLQSALLGGGALTAATGVEQLLFKQGKKMGKKAKGKKKQAMDLAQLQELLAQQRPATGLAALGAGQQLLLGAALGAAAAYVLGDEQLRTKLLRAGLQLYESVTGGLAEMKEQVADIQAEMAATPPRP